MRDRYLHVAAHLFAERGYNGVSIEDLGAAAGVSGPALYRHFSSKESILIELLVSASERLLSGCRATIVSGNPPLSTLTQLIDFHIDFSLSEPSIIRIQDRELANLSAESNQRVRRLQREYVANWIGVLSKLVPEWTEREVNVRVIAAFGLMNSTPFSARAGELELARGILAEMTITSLLGGPGAQATSVMET
jgi:AcrR family transcriptional regulator